MGHQKQQIQTGSYNIFCKLKILLSFGDGTNDHTRSTKVNTAGESPNHANVQGWRPLIDIFSREIIKDKERFSKCQATPWKIRDRDKSENEGRAGNNREVHLLLCAFYDDSPRILNPHLGALCGSRLGHTGCPTNPIHHSSTSVEKNERFQSKDRKRKSCAFSRNLSLAIWQQ